MTRYANMLSVLIIPLATSGALAQASLGLAPTDDVTAKKHMGPTGRPCISVAGYSIPHALDKQVFDNMIEATNACSQVIKLKVCYYHSDRCVDVDAPAYSRKGATLGVMPALSQFRFEVKERFYPYSPF
jgi:hypothetical protein